MGKQKIEQIIYTIKVHYISRTGEVKMNEFITDNFDEFVIRHLEVAGILKGICKPSPESPLNGADVISCNTILEPSSLPY